MMNNSLFKQSLLMTTLMGALYASNLQAQSMTDLGTFSGTFSYANGVSGDGSVIVGGASILGDVIVHAFKYTGSTMTDLGTLVGGSYSYAYGASNDGSVIVGYSDTASGATRAFKYTGSTMSDLGTLGGTNSYANGVSGDGSVIVGSASTSGDTSVHAFKYSGTTMTDLGTLVGGSYSFAYGASNDGSVIVGYGDTGSVEHAFKYSGGTMTDLGTLGGDNSHANGVSGDGSVIVGYSDITGNSATHAFKYTGSTMTDLGTLGGTYSYAFGVSSNGSVIVGYASTLGNSATHAFKYSGTTMTDLGTLGGTYSYAYGVSSDGSVIVGYSYIAGDTTLHAFVYRSSMVDVNNTFTALATQGYQLNSLLNAQNTALAVNLNTDCVVFGANNVCVAVGGRYTNVSTPSTTQSTGSVQLGYRFDPTLRAGVFLDQGISNATPNNYQVKSSQPLAGLFAVYAPSGTSLGAQIKVSAAYSSNGVNISRNTLANTEAGQGSSTMTTQGAQLEGAYGFALNDGWIASPLLGIKATQVSRNGYSETAGATFPVTYNAVTQSATTTYAGAKVFGYVAPQVSIGANAGVEQDLASSISKYSGTIDTLGAFNQTAPAIKKTRAFVAANTDYWLEKNQRVSFGVYYNQQSFNTANGITAMLSYTIGL